MLINWTYRKVITGNTEDLDSHKWLGLSNQDNFYKREISENIKLVA